MPSQPPPEHPFGPVAMESVRGAADATAESATLHLHAEEATVSKRVRRTLVRAATSTATRHEVVEAALERVEVVVDRVPVGRIVDEVPPVRVEGDVTIMPVVTEELVLVRRLVLKEEVHLRTVRSVAQHVETVALREQSVAITRTPLDD